MNRLQLDVALEARSRTTPSQKSKTKQQDSIHHRFFIPLHYEKNYAYPLLVWLHGPTGGEHEINQVMPHISVRNYVGVSPRGVVKHSATHQNGDPTFTWDQSESSVEEALENVLECISRAKQRFNIADDRVFLAGNDVGGTMALRLALTHPEHFAGVASIGGTIPDARQPLAFLDQVRSMPVMLLQGRDSVEYETHDVCRDLRLLHAAGMSATIHQYPCEQEVTTKMLSDLNSWIMERVSGVPANAGCYDDPTRMRIHDCN